VLLLRRGATGLPGHAPRMHYDVDYRSRLWYGQTVQIELAVARVGELR
jgi:acyl-CoA thioester hydrolase